ncbi:hypothetical protein Tco_0185692 [Tanacetum coccineum]
MKTNDDHDDDNEQGECDPMKISLLKRKRVSHNQETLMKKTILGGDQLLVILCGFGTKSLEFGISFLSMTISGAASYAYSGSLLLTPLCCDDIHDVTPLFPLLAGCDRFGSEPCSLIPLSRGSFDVIVGMDWLSKRKFVIVCHEKVVRIPLEGDEILRVHGERTQGVVKTLMNAKVDELKLSDISVVRDFIDVFPEDLSMTTAMTRAPVSFVKNRSMEFNLKLVLELYEEKKLPTYVSCATFSKIVKPITSLIERNQKYEWGTERKEAFQTMKNDLCDASINRMYSLIPLSRGSFDVIVGMDRLSKRKFAKVCHEKVVRISLEGDEILRVHGERTQGVVKTLMNAKVDELKLSDISVTRVSYDLVIFREEHHCRLLRRGAWSSFEVSVRITDEGEVVTYLRFIANFSKIVKPITSLIERNQKYKWGAERKEAFQTMKNDLYNSKKWNSGDDQLRFRWRIYLVVLADAAESVSDAIGFEYCLASSSGWTK